MHQHARDITGLTSGYLLAISYAGSNGRRSLWNVKCNACGKMVVLPASELQKGRLKSCGCMRYRIISEKNTNHGMSGKPIWNVWHSMKQRCENPKAQAWNNYGGRGISVCQRWSESFEAFYQDMAPGYSPGLTLDRIDVNGNYEPGNCRWATYQEQARNTRKSRIIDTPWGRMTVIEASERSGIGETTLLYRLDHGITGDSLFVKPDFRNTFTTSGVQVRGAGSQSRATQE